MTVVPAEVTIGGLHAGQYEVLQDDHRFQVLVAGRRWGKTRMGVAKCVAACVERPGPYWWVTPDYPRSDQGWLVLTEFARAFHPSDVKVELTHRRVWFPGGGYVQVKSADDPNSLRGTGLRGVVLDEAAFMKATVWPTIRPSLAEHQGWALFISTPNGLNWFSDLFDRATANPAWATWQRRQSENPKVPEAETEAQRVELGAFMAAQEIDAEFISTRGRVFSQEWFRSWRLDDEFIVLRRPEGDRRWHSSEIRTFGTCDPAATEKETSSYFVLCIWGVTPEADLILVHRFRAHAQTTRHLGILIEQYEHWRPDYIGIERAHVGYALIQAAVNRGIPVREIPAERDKVSRARVAAARYEAGKVYHPVDAAWLGEWERELLGFPDGDHDDQVDNVAYAAIEVAAGAGQVWKQPSFLR